MRTYVIRDEGIKPILGVLEGLVPKIVISFAQKEFKDDFTKVIEVYLPEDVEVKVDSLQRQIVELTKVLPEGAKTISLDAMYRGTYSIRMSRLFKANSDQCDFIDLCSSHDRLDLQEQISYIPNGHYILVDDASVAKDTILEIISSLSGTQTLQSEIVKNKYYQTNSMMRFIGTLSSDIIIDDVQLLSKHDGIIFDTVDLRDFIFGVSDAGLMLLFDNNIRLRAPYIFPFVNLTSRARIRDIDVKSFSREICKLNYINE